MNGSSPLISTHVDALTTGRTGPSVPSFSLRYPLHWMKSPVESRTIYAGPPQVDWSAPASIMSICWLSLLLRSQLFSSLLILNDLLDECQSFFILNDIPRLRWLIAVEFLLVFFPVSVNSSGIFSSLSVNSTNLLFFRGFSSISSSSSLFSFAVLLLRMLGVDLPFDPDGSFFLYFFVIFH